MNTEQYFYRTAIFTRRDNQIALAEINQPDDVRPLDDWLGTVETLGGSYRLTEFPRGNRQTHSQQNGENTVESVLASVQALSH